MASSLPQAPKQKPPRTGDPAIDTLNDALYQADTVRANVYLDTEKEVVAGRLATEKRRRADSECASLRRALETLEAANKPQPEVTYVGE